MSTPPQTQPNTLASKSAEKDYRAGTSASAYTHASQLGVREHEVSTPPLTPILAPKPLHQRMPPPKRAQSIQAHKPFCAICLFDISQYFYKARVEHVNKCWQLLHQAFQEQGMRKRVKDSKRVKMPDNSESSEILPTSISSNTLPPGGPTTNQREAFTSAELPPTSCVLCFHSLSHLDSVSAQSHRLVCLAYYHPFFCPICSTLFLSSGLRWTTNEISWHIHNCQHGGSLSEIDRTDFESLCAALTGRQEYSRRRFSKAVGLKKNFTHHEHPKRYKVKCKLGYLIGEQRGFKGGYLYDMTPLRAIRSVNENGDVEVVETMKTNARGWGAMERFRRCPFHVLEGLRIGAKFPAGFRMDTVIRKVEPAEKQNTKILPNGLHPASPAEDSEGTAEKRSRADAGPLSPAEAASNAAHPISRFNHELKNTPDALSPPPGFSAPSSSVADFDQFLLVSTYPLRPQNSTSEESEDSGSASKASSREAIQHITMLSNNADTQSASNTCIGLESSPSTTASDLHGLLDVSTRPNDILHDPLSDTAPDEQTATHSHKPKNTTQDPGSGYVGLMATLHDASLQTSNHISQKSQPSVSGETGLEDAHVDLPTAILPRLVTVFGHIRLTCSSYLDQHQPTPPHGPVNGSPRHHRLAGAPGSKIVFGQGMEMRTSTFTCVDEIDECR